MPLLLQDVDFQDGVTIADIYISAFYDDPFNKTLFPGVSFDQQVAGVISRWPGNYGAVSAHYKKVVDSESGKIISYSKWSFAFTNAGDVLRQPGNVPAGVEIRPPSTPEGLNDPFAIEFTEKLDEVREHILGNCPQLHLKMMGTRPSHQRQGVASLQLAWAVQIADKNGLACWWKRLLFPCPYIRSLDSRSRVMWTRSWMILVVEGLTGILACCGRRINHPEVGMEGL
ncbi:hypothetical protein ONS96_002951 [Cadophora gregata f. sp. sojae]|nr:hypothetical protein ONS96_002951 [Cadophora gregata f. sp. sojae]